MTAAQTPFKVSLAATAASIVLVLVVFELIRSRRGVDIDPSDADMALRLLGLPNDSARIGSWSKAFLDESR